MKRYIYFTLVFFGLVIIYSSIDKVLGDSDRIYNTIVAMGIALFWAIETKK